MKLKELQIEGYKCFRDKVLIPINNLTVLIGENDSGKSTILKAIDLLLSKNNASEYEFFILNDNQVDEFIIVGIFEIQGSDNKDELKKYILENQIVLKKRFKKGEAFKTFISKSLLSNRNLENYTSLNAEDTKQLLIDLGINSFARQEDRKEAIKQYLENNWDILPKIRSEVDILFNNISQYFPSFQYYGSHAYGNPQGLVKKTLDSIYSSHFYNEAGDLKIKSIKGLKEKVLNQLNKNIEENLLAKIKIYNSKILKIQGRLDIDFSKGLDFEGLELDEGNGFKLVDQKGEGSKKRLFLSILEWDKEVQSGLTNNRAIIRGYDEPDSNLHYEAQRKMFSAISEIANNLSSNIQAIISTHSIAMIDRAPSNSIVHVINNNGISSIDFLKSDGDNDIANFLNQISIIGGIKNSSIFYEKCFLIVEGESEESAIPGIYKKIYNRNLVEDGIVLINIQSNGAWYNFLKLLNKNKSSCTVMLLDSDTQNPDCGANVTISKLNEIGFNNNFLTQNVFFAGIQEFEDLFPDNKIRDTFNNLYPRSTKIKWSIKHVKKMRLSNPKISKSFDKEAFKFIAHHKKRYRKPEFAIKLIDLCTKRELEKIVILTSMFKKIHQIIN